jgi:hypothetical protein
LWELELTEEVRRWCEIALDLWARARE